MPHSSRQEIVNANLVKSYLWHRMEKLKLIRKMGARINPRFGNFLLRVVNGKEPTTLDDWITLPKEMTIKYNSMEGEKIN